LFGDIPEFILVDKVIVVSFTGYPEVVRWEHRSFGVGETELFVITECWVKKEVVLRGEGDVIILYKMGVIFDNISG